MRIYTRTGKESAYKMGLSFGRVIGVKAKSDQIYLKDGQMKAVISHPAERRSSETNTVATVSHICRQSIMLQQSPSRDIKTALWTVSVQLAARCMCHLRKTEEWRRPTTETVLPRRWTAELNRRTLFPSIYHSLPFSLVTLSLQRIQMQHHFPYIVRRQL